MFEAKKAEKIANAVHKETGGKVTQEVLESKHVVIHVDTHGFHATIGAGNGDILFVVFDDSGAQVNHKTIHNSANVAAIVRTLADLLPKPDTASPENTPFYADGLNELLIGSSDQLSYASNDFWWNGDGFSLAGLMLSNSLARMSITANIDIMAKIMELLKGE